MYVDVDNAGAGYRGRAHIVVKLAQRTGLAEERVDDAQNLRGKTCGRPVNEVHGNSRVAVRTLKLVDLGKTTGTYVVDRPPALFLVLPGLFSLSFLIFHRNPAKKESVCMTERTAIVPTC